MKVLPLGATGRRAAADRSAGHEPLWLEWAALFGLLAFASWLLGARGVWALLLRADPTGLTLVIVVVFAASTLWCGARARALQRERDRLDRDPVRHGPDGTRKAIDPRHDPDLGWAAEYRRMLHAAGGDAATALDLLLERTHGPHGTAWWVNGIQLKLGLLGKVIASRSSRSRSATCRASTPRSRRTCCAA